MKQDGDKESKSENATRKRVRHRKKLLYEKILKQMEFYFSDANLSKDRFLSQLIAESEFVPLETFLKFNNIRALTHDVSDIAKAMKHSALLELGAERGAVRRRAPLEPYDADARTVYVESLPAGASRDWLQRVLGEYGSVAYISMPKFRDSQRIKGFAFVEFGSEEEAQKCLHVFTKMGCLLPTNLPPEELSSIKTFAEEPAPPEPPAPPAPPAPDHKEPFEPPKKKAKKNKDKKNNKNCDQLESDPAAKPSPPEDMQEEKIPAAPQAGEAGEPAEVGEAGVEGGEEGEGEARRKRRKKRAAEPCAGAGDEARGALWGLQVLSKRSWKALRNRYLNLQRALGRGGRRRGWAPPAPAAAPPPPAAPPQPDGVFVRVTLAEPCRDVRDTKRQLGGAAGAVHCEARAGRADALLRFRSADAASQYVESVVASGAGEVAVARVLGGAECAAEWARAAAARAARRARAPPALPAEPQPSATHVRFDDE